MAPRDTTAFTYLDRGTESWLLHVHVVPGAARTELLGLHGDRLKIRIKAPPRGGAANRELLRFLGELFEVAPSALEVVRGASDRRKTVRLPAHLDAEGVLRRGGA